MTRGTSAGVGGWLAFVAVCIVWVARNRSRPVLAAPEAAQRSAQPADDLQQLEWAWRTQALETYYSATSTVSSIVRQLALVGIAIVWLFSGVDLRSGRGLDIPAELLWPGVLLVGTLGLDLLQYVYRTVAWGSWAWWLHRQGDKYRELAPRWINLPSHFLFSAKVLTIAVAYSGLGWYLHGLMPG